MKIFQRILFLAALLAGCVHVLWIAHHLWVESRGSVMDAFDPPARHEIRDAASLEELLAKYREADAAVKVHEEERGKPELSPYEQERVEPYRTRALVREGIEDWEEKEREIRRLRFFWSAGLLLTLVGALLLRRSPWLGIGLLIAGFTEMLYWCSPGYFFGASRQFDRLLTHELVFGLLTLLALGVVAWRAGILRQEAGT